MKSLKPKRILIILYAGDYYNAYYRMKNGLGEAYSFHNYTLDSISRLSRKDGVEEIAVLGCATDQAYSNFKDIGFRDMGAGVDHYQDRKSINKIIAG